MRVRQILRAADDWAYGLPLRFRRALSIAVAAILAALPVVVILLLVGARNQYLFADWEWYSDGPRRLVEHAPALFGAAMLTGPYDQFSVVNQWDQAPGLLAFTTPFLLVPEAFRQAAWGWAMSACLVLSAAIVWPRRLWAGTSIVLAFALLCVGLAPTTIYTWSAIISAIYWGNFDAALALAVALVWLGERIDRRSLMVIGLLIASAKVLPAVGLGLWLLDRRQGRAVLHGVIGSILLTVPALVQWGPSMFVDFVTSVRLLVPTYDWQNTSPLGLLAPLIGRTGAHTAGAILGAGIAAGALAARRISPEARLFILMVAVLAPVPNLWVHWWVVPIVAGLAWLGRSSRLYRFDAAWHAFNVMGAR
jgi:hypothetical protein